MKIDEFWATIEAARIQSEGDDEKLLDLIRDRLKRLDPAEIISFDEIYDSLRFRAYRRELWGAAYLLNGGCSDDGFEYFRAWLISRGKSIYEAALTDPDSLADQYDPSADDYELEGLMYVASEAYEERAGSDMPERERLFPELTGVEWNENDLGTRYPKIWARMNETDA